MHVKSKMQVPSSGHGLHNYTMIKEWITGLYDGNCFCPDDKDKPFDTMLNISCYVTSPGTEFGGVSDARDARFIHYNSAFGFGTTVSMCK
jgi:hypothetical protein